MRAQHTVQTTIEKLLNPNRETQGFRVKLQIRLMSLEKNATKYVEERKSWKPSFVTLGWDFQWWEIGRRGLRMPSGRLLLVLNVYGITDYFRTSSQKWNTFEVSSKKNYGKYGYRLILLNTMFLKKISYIWGAVWRQRAVSSCFGRLLQTTWGDLVSAFCIRMNKTCSGIILRCFVIVSYLSVAGAISVSCRPKRKWGWK